MTISISRQQLRYMAGCARGQTHAQIAAATGVTTDGVRSALRRMYTSLGLTGTAHLVAYGYTTGLLAGLTPEPGPPAVLTPAQLRVLQGLADGLDYAAIGHRHYLTTHTIRTQAHRIYQTLGITGTKYRAAARAVAIGYQHSHLPTPTATALPAAIS